MEVKLSHCRRTTPLCLQYPSTSSSSLTTTSNFQSPSYYLKSWLNNTSSFKKHFRKLAQKWRVQLEEVLQGQQSTKTFFCSHRQRCCAEKNGLPISNILQSKKHDLRNVLEGFSSKKICSVLSFHHLPRAKPTGYVLVLVPLVAFCIQCIISALHIVVRKTGPQQGQNESTGHPFTSETKSQRWKCALSDIREPDNMQSMPAPNSASPEEEEDPQVSSEELSLAYRRLEQDYDKFLSQCGMSQWGHWRGGSPD